MSYNSNGNPYAQYLRNVPCPRGTQLPLRVGNPILTKYGQGIITEIKFGYGGVYYGDNSTMPQLALSILFPGQKVSVDIPFSSVIFQGSYGQSSPEDTVL